MISFDIFCRFLVITSNVKVKMNDAECKVARHDRVESFVMAISHISTGNIWDPRYNHRGNPSPYFRFILIVKRAPLNRALSLTGK